ncbi:MAG: hypothetical protein KG029_06675 [Bacteroidetes bacterium]|jgi:cytoskeletal protein RodZ|nr:hypothetical protein [Bacteroidota bacterium]
MTTKRRRSPVRKTRSRTSKSNNFLKSVLLILVVLISLALIAFAASYVYLRNSEEGEIENSIENTPSDAESKSDFTERTEAEFLSTEAELKKKSELKQTSLLEGTWVSAENGAMFTVANSSFTIDFPSIEAVKPMRGQITVSKNSFVTVNNKDMAACQGVEGNYSFELNGEDLVIKLKKDKCTQRASQLNASWFRL